MAEVDTDAFDTEKPGMRLLKIGCALSAACAASLAVLIVAGHNLDKALEALFWVPPCVLLLAILMLPAITPLAYIIAIGSGAPVIGVFGSIREAKRNWRGVFGVTLMIGAAVSVYLAADNLFGHPPTVAQSQKTFELPSDEYYYLGNMYLNGKEMPQNYAKAMMWLRKGAEQGDAKVQFMLGGMYLFGWGTSKDYGEAMKWFRNAAEQGNPLAQYCLGGLYFSVQSGEQDYVQAHKWFNLAATRLSDSDINTTTLSNAARREVEGRMSQGQIDEAQHLASVWRVQPFTRIAVARKSEGGEEVPSAEEAAAAIDDNRDNRRDVSQRVESILHSCSVLHFSDSIHQ